MLTSLPRFTATSLSLLCLLIGCSGAATDDASTAPSGIPLLGNGSHSTSEVSIETIATQADGLTDPRDLDFHPKTGDLWVANGIDSTATVLVSADRRSEWLCSDHGLALGMAAIVVVA